MNVFSQYSFIGYVMGLLLNIISNGDFSIAIYHNFIHLSIGHGFPVTYVQRMNQSYQNLLSITYCKFSLHVYAISYTAMHMAQN